MAHCHGLWPLSSVSQNCFTTSADCNGDKGRRLATIIACRAGHGPYNPIYKCTTSSVPGIAGQHQDAVVCCDTLKLLQIKQCSPNNVVDLLWSSQGRHCCSKQCIQREQPRRLYPINGVPVLSQTQIGKKRQKFGIWDASLACHIRVGQAWHSRSPGAAGLQECMVPGGLGASQMGLFAHSRPTQRILTQGFAPNDLASMGDC